MIKTRVEHRCLQLEHSASIRDCSDVISVEEVNPQYILLQEVARPYTLEMVSIATKECVCLLITREIILPLVKPMNAFCNTVKRIS